MDKMIRVCLMYSLISFALGCALAYLTGGG